MPHARKVIALTLLLAVAGAALAQCARGPTTSEVTVPGFVAVYYQSFKSDTGADVVDFYGGVCVTAVGGEWTVMAESVTVTGLTGQLGLQAPNPSLYMGPWLITAGHLEATLEELWLTDATVTGPGVDGGAQRLSVDLASGEMTMVDLRLNSVAFAVRGTVAVLRGESLTLVDAGVSTCIGLETPPYEIVGLRAEVDLAARSVVLEGGALQFGSLNVPLQEQITISEESLAAFSLPVRVQNVPDPGRQGKPGAGLGVRLVGLPVGDDVTLDVGATGIDTEHDTGLVALLNIAATIPGSLEGDAITAVTSTFGLEAGLPYLDVDLTRPLTPWLGLSLGAFSGAAPGQDGRHEIMAKLTATTPVAAVNGRVSAEVFSAATALAPSLDPTLTSILGTRVGGAVYGTASTRATAVGTFSVDARAEATSYPAQDAWQWGVRFVPSWRYVTGPLTLRLSHDQRYTNAGSPFGATVDLLAPRARAEGSVRVAGVLYKSATAAQDGNRSQLDGFFDVRAAHDLIAVDGEPVGWRQARASAGLTYLVRDWELSTTVAAEFAGLLSSGTDRDSFAAVDVSAKRRGWPVIMPSRPQPNVPHTAFEVGVNSVVGFTAADPGLRSLELRAAVPFAFDRFEVRPYLAFDFAPTVEQGLLPIWSVHGVDLTIISCCGSFTMGYRNDTGVWSASISVDLARRPPVREE